VTEPDEMLPSVDSRGGRRWSLREIEESYVQRYAYPVAREVAGDMIDEWDYAADPHGFCHDRSVLIALLTEIDRLNGLLREASMARG